MALKQNQAWAELVQLVPIISLALPFIVQGSVDLRRAAFGFLVAAGLTVPVCALVLMRGQLLNPILVGTAAWLWLGALAFNLPIEPLANWLSDTQAFGLFVGALVAGIAATLFSRYGYVACFCDDTRWLRRASYVLLGLTALVVAWSWFFRHNIRLGGGLPFIVLNVARRVMGRRAPRPTAQGAASV